MAYYFKGNRILTEEENANEGCGEALGGAFIMFLGVLFILSPGILITSLLNLFIDFTTSQLWGTAIVGCIIVIIGLFALTERKRWFRKKIFDYSSWLLIVYVYKLSYDIRK